MENKTTNAIDTVVRYTAGKEEVALSPRTVMNYLVSGDKERVSMQELVMFINLCKYNGLNPWLREAYCIKFGNDPATIVVGKEAYMKRAVANPTFDGFECGIIVLTEPGEIAYRKGGFYMPGEKVVGGYAEVWRKDMSHSVRVEISFDEYAVRKRDGSLNAQWSKRPATMIRKVALVQALREAFPNDLGGMSTAEEVGVTEPEEAKVETPVVAPSPAKPAIEKAEDPFKAAEKKKDSEEPEQIEMDFGGVTNEADIG